MPRRNSAVKNKVEKVTSILTRSLGVVDLHFHGAFGIDLMRATEAELNELAERLWHHGVSAFCPTTLSTRATELQQTVERLGPWIARKQRESRSRDRSKPQGALPLGIHLEGPFLHPEAAGAHPPGAIRELDFEELDRLWAVSEKTLKILTLAPERLSPTQLRKVASWARTRKILLSLGHSRATEEQAEAAFLAGFRSVTHAWNALPFHHRNAGPLGAAFGRKDTYIELIIDQVHLAPTLLRWTCQLHPIERTCFVSDCAPAACLKTGRRTTFGPLEVEFRNGACRIASEGPTKGGLAGGGLLLSESFAQWVETEARFQNRPLKEVLLTHLPAVTQGPLAALGLSPKLLENHQGSWRISRSASSRRLKFEPILSG